MKMPKWSEKVRWQHVVVTVGAVVMFIMVASAVASSGSTKDRFNAEYPVNEASISKLKSEIEELDNTPVVERDEIAEALYSAQVAGNRVAMLQNEFRVCENAADVESAMLANYEALMKCFSGEDAAGWQVWFDGLGSLPSLKWSFMTNYSMGTSEFQCTWFLRDERNELVAYATALYDGTTGLFSGTEVHITAYGDMNYRDGTEMYDPGDDDPNEGFEKVETPTTDFDIPDGYHLDEEGNIVDAEGNPYTSSSVIGKEFDEEFRQAVANRASGQLGSMDEIAARGGGSDEEA